MSKEVIVVDQTRTLPGTFIGLFFILYFISKFLTYYIRYRHLTETKYLDCERNSFNFIIYFWNKKKKNLC